MPTNGKLKELINRDTLRQLAGAKSFERGEDYFAMGQVLSLVEHDGKLLASVQGTETYEVTLFAEDDELVFDCTCPMGDDGAFCKHSVAVGLTWLAGTKKSSTKKNGERSSSPVVTLEDARTWLAGRGTKELVDMILDQAARDSRLRDRLLLQAAKSAGKGANVTAIRAAMDRATRVGGFIRYREAYGFAGGISEVVESIADLLKQGFAAEVIELTEYSLEKVEQATGQMDDSDGNMGGILNRLQELHLAACERAKPDPEELAERLFEWEMRAAFDTFYHAAGTYAKVLGASGLATYRRLAEAGWAKVPQLRPGEKDPEEYGRSFRVKSIMEALATQSGNVDELVLIKARDLSNTYAFFQIATIYHEAKRHDDALAWAERGTKAFPEKTDSRLREFLAEEYHRRKRHDEAMQLMWSEFAESPDLENYQKLKRHSNRIGRWAAWRGKALGFVRAEIVREKEQSSRKAASRWGAYWRWADHSLLVEIFLWEKDPESAWCEAQLGGCDESWWMQLAAAREKEFPADAIPIYQRQVELLINQKHNGGYQDAVKLLGRVRRLMDAQGEDFPTYLAAVRTTHKPKRNFMKLSEKL
jgi:uncharacterized Zn finger protein